jgi:hypothetical protein
MQQVCSRLLGSGRRKASRPTLFGGGLRAPFSRQEDRSCDYDDGCIIVRGQEAVTEILDKVL